MTDVRLPDYDRPPAVETLMGFYFASLPDWSVLHYGSLWAVLKPDYPKAEVLPPIVDPRALLQGNVQFTQIPFRALFADLSDCQLVQVQPSAFLRNWRKTTENQAYTHFRDLKPKFRKDWDRFCDFLRDNGLRQPEVFQAEVTYVNHFVRGVDWEAYSDLAQLIKPFAPRREVADFGREYQYLPEAASIALNEGYNLSDIGVSLQIACHSAVRKPDGTEVIQMTITARADVQDEGSGAMWAMLDRCHDAVILGFDDVTTERAHRNWGKL